MRVGNDQRIAAVVHVQEILRKASACGAGGGPGRPGFQPGNSCARRGSSAPPVGVTYTGPVTDLHREIWSTIGKDGIRDSNTARAVGKIVQEHVRSSMAGTISRGEELYAESQRAMALHAAAVETNMPAHVVQKLRAAAVGTLGNAYKALEEIDQQRTQKLISTVRSLRDFGGELDPNVVKVKSDFLRDSLNEAVSNLPKDWVDSINQHYTELDIDRETVRGNSWFGTAENSPKRAMIRILSPRGGSTTHELVHAAEVASRQRTIDHFALKLGKLQRDFIKSRITDDEEMVELIPGTGIRGYKDKFTEPYMGRVYGPSLNYVEDNYEILTVGIQRLFHTKTGLSADADYEAFVVGTLVGH